MPGSGGPIATLGFQNMGPDPSPIANSAVITANDDNGQTFRAYFAQGVDGANATLPAQTSYGTALIKVVDSQTIEVTMPGNVTTTYKLNPSLGSGVYVETGGVANPKSIKLTKATDGNRLGNFTFNPLPNSGQKLQFFGFGHVTQPSMLPGSASFSSYTSGISSNLFLAEAGSSNVIQMVNGIVQLQADFNTGTVSGILFDNGSYVQDYYTLYISLENAKINGSAFSGNSRVLTMTSNFDPTVALAIQSDGQAAGQFTGLNASSVVGAFGGQMTSTASSGVKNWTYSGVFGGG